MLLWEKAVHLESICPQYTMMSSIKAWQHLKEPRTYHAWVTHIIAPINLCNGITKRNNFSCKLTPPTTALLQACCFSQEKKVFYLKIYSSCKKSDKNGRGNSSSQLIQHMAPEPIYILSVFEKHVIFLVGIFNANV